MKKYLISFLAGLLSIGVGAGVCFAEFIQFEYGGTKTIAAKNAATTYTATLDFALEADIILQSQFGHNIKGAPKVAVSADPTLEKNEMRAEVDNKGNEVSFDIYEVSNKKGANTIVLNAYGNNEFGIVRRMMEDSKDSLYYDYVVDISDCELRLYVHPEQVNAIKIQMNT